MPDMKKKWTEETIADVIREHYLPEASTLIQEEWAFLTQFPLQTGRNQRRVDVLAARNWSGGPKKHQKIVYEIKISRSDYRNETRIKRIPAETHAHRCYYATPPGLLKPEEIHEKWGLAEIHTDEEGNHRLKIVKRAKVLHPEPDPTDVDAFLAAALRRASRQEERNRRDQTAEPETLAAALKENKSLKGKLARARTALKHARNQADDITKQMMSMTGNPVCDRCRTPIRFVLHRRRRGTWEHIETGVRCYHEPYPAEEEDGL